MNIIKKVSRDDNLLEWHGTSVWMSQKLVPEFVPLSVLLNKVWERHEV